MKSMGMMTGKKQTTYTATAVVDLEDVMTPEELAQAQVRGYSIQVIEPGAQQANTFTLPLEFAPSDIDSYLFGPVEIECRTAQARGWVKKGQTSGAVEAPVTFRATAIRKVDLAAVHTEMAAREQQDTSASEHRRDQRDFFDALRKTIEERQKGVLQAAAGKPDKGGK